MDSILDLITLPDAWESYYAHKSSRLCPEAFIKELRAFVDARAYAPVCEAISRGEAFPLPEKRFIEKPGSSKKRAVYTYPPAENMVLKLVTFLLLRRYDGLFSPNLYSFRPEHTAKGALRSLLGVRGIRGMFSYKVDVSDYFNSIDITRFLPELECALHDDPRLYAFLSALLTEPAVIYKKRIIKETKGIMAGTPQAAFYANLFLRGLDEMFYLKGIPYCRYSDDIITFAPDKDGAAANAELIRAYLAEKGLKVNPDKECFTSPEEGFTFLGFYCANGKTDIARASLKKIKQKMRRKMRALQRWQHRKQLDGSKAARAFIKAFNRKMFENSAGSELTWAYWYFPVITTADSLHEIDLYAQECIRFLISGTRTKARYSVRYEDMKQLGYRSLVHEYYAYNGEARLFGSAQTISRT